MPMGNPTFEEMRDYAKTEFNKYRLDNPALALTAITAASAAQSAITALSEATANTQRHDDVVYQMKMN